MNRRRAISPRDVICVPSSYVCEGDVRERHRMRGKGEMHCPGSPPCAKVYYDISPSVFQSVGRLFAPQCLATLTCKMDI